MKMKIKIKLNFKINRLFAAFLLLPSFLITYQGCRSENLNSKKDSENSFAIDLNKLQSKISFDSLISDVELIPLETADQALIKTVDKFIFFENKFYILDKGQKALFIFGENGKFERKIQKIGIGPGEYSLLYDFNINRYTNNIELLNPRGEILEYDLNGNFISETKIPLPASHFFIDIDSNLIFIFSRFEPKKLFYFSRKSKSIINSEFEIPDFINSKTSLIREFSPFYYSNNKVFFYQGFSSIFYEVKEGKISKSFKFDFGDSNLDIDKMPSDKNLLYYDNYLRKGKFTYGFEFFSENNQYIFLKFIYKEMWTFLFYNKQLHKYVVFTRFTERIYPPLYPVFIEKGMLTTIEPIHLQLLVKPEILDKSNQDIYSKIRLEDNPVIVKYSFK